MNSYQKMKAALKVLLLMCGFLNIEYVFFPFEIALFRRIELANIFAIFGIIFVTQLLRAFPFLIPNYLPFHHFLRNDVPFETFISL